MPFPGWPLDVSFQILIFAMKLEYFHTGIYPAQLVRIVVTGNRKLEICFPFIVFSDDAVNEVRSG